MILSKDLLFKSIQRGAGGGGLKIWQYRLLSIGVLYAWVLRSMGSSSLWKNYINSLVGTVFIL